MKREIAQFVKKKMFDLPTNQSGTSKVVRLLQPLSILERKWEHISMDFVFIKKKKKTKNKNLHGFVFGLPRSPRNHDAIWVVVDRSVHFILIRTNY